MIRLQRNRTQAPTGVVDLNGSSSLTDGLLLFVPLSSPPYFIDLVSGKGPVAATPPTIKNISQSSPGRLGNMRIGSRFISANSQYLKFKLPVVSSLPYSIATGTVGMGVNTTCQLVAIGPDTGTDYTMRGIYTSSGAELRTAISTTAGSFPSGSQAAGNTLGATESARMVSTFVSSSVWTMMMEGRPKTTKTGGSSSPFAVDNLFIGTRYTSGILQGFLNSSLEFVAAWNRVLSDEESASINQNPWQLTRPNNKTYFFGGQLQRRRIFIIS